MDAENFSVLLDRLPPPIGTVDLSTALNAVAARYGVDPDSIFEKSHVRKIVYKRWEVFWLAREMGATYPEIADFFDMDHASVFHGVRKMQAIIDDYNEG